MGPEEKKVFDIGDRIVVVDNSNPKQFDFPSTHADIVLELFPIGLTGTVVDLYRELIGVRFDLEKESESTHFHNLRGRIEGRYGRWIRAGGIDHYCEDDGFNFSDGDLESILFPDKSEVL